VAKRVLGSPGTAPYSPGVVGGDFVFVSGQVGSEPVTRQVPTDVESQTKICLERIADVLAQAGTSMDKVVRATVYLTDMSNFSRMNGVYKTFFPTEPPARTTIGVSGLASPAFLVEIDVVALAE